MKYFLNFIILMFLTVSIIQAQKTDLSAKWDTVRQLANPDKGYTRSGRKVEVGLNENLRDPEGYYRISEIIF